MSVSDFTAAEIREILERGQQTDFWKVICRHLDDEWGPGGQRFAKRIDALADNQDDASAIHHIRQIAVTRREMLRLMTWPGDEAKRLKALEANQDRQESNVVSLARGGYHR